MSAFLPRLVNDPFGDPGLYVLLRNLGRAVLFDLGDLGPLTTADLLKVGHVFVSHTHMDHFVGFDRLLRAILGRDADVALYGPPGFIENARGKLAGYTWNLTGDYPMAITVHEVRPDRVERLRLRAATAFAPEPLEPLPFDGVLAETEDWTVRAARLDHRIPCLAFALEESTRLAVRPERLREMNIPAGPWLRELKDAIRADAPPETPIVARWRDADGSHERAFRLGDLRERLILEAPGARVAYVTDAVFHRENVEKIVELARGADVLFCESLFLDVDRDQAAMRRHLTARQAGTLARLAGVGRLETFHYSPRYAGRADELVDEAQRTFRGEIPPDGTDDGYSMTPVETSAVRIASPAAEPRG